MIRLLALGLVAAALTSCSDAGTGVGSGATFVVVVGSEQFRVLIDDEQLITQARRMITGAEPQKIVNGELDNGDGGFNTGYRWHMKPSTVSFADLTIELCDGRPSDIESNLNYWINTVKRYCPWGGQIVAEVGVD